MEVAAAEALWNTEDPAAAFLYSPSATPRTVKTSSPFVLDEPTAHLDAATAEAVMDTVWRLVDDGLSLLLITHELENDQQAAEKTQRITLP